MQSVLDRPLTAEQLRDVEVCPRHNTMLLMEEFGNVDSAMICPDCKRELQAQKTQEVDIKYSRATKTWWVIDGDKFEDFADMKAHITEFESFIDAFNHYQKMKGGI